MGLAFSLGAVAGTFLGRLGRRFGTAPMIRLSMLVPGRCTCSSRPRSPVLFG